jgi:hypothetical protein
MIMEQHGETSNKVKSNIRVFPVTMHNIGNCALEDWALALKDTFPGFGTKSEYNMQSWDLYESESRYKMSLPVV